MNWQEIITDCGPALLPGDLKDFELQLSYSLPVDYFEFLLAYNGGSINFEHEFFSETMDEGLFVYCLDPLNGDETNLGIKGFREMQMADRWYRKELLNIGSDMGTGYYFLVLDGPERGAVYFSYQDDLVPLELASWNSANWCIPKTMHKVASTFNDLGVLISKSACD